MSDTADMAEENEELLRQVALKFRRPNGPVATGFCHNCDEPVAPTMRWCDADCRDMWAKRMGR